MPACGPCEGTGFIGSSPCSMCGALGFEGGRPALELYVAQIKKGPAIQTGLGVVQSAMGDVEVHKSLCKYCEGLGVVSSFKVWNKKQRTKRCEPCGGTGRGFPSMDLSYSSEVSSATIREQNNPISPEQLAEKEEA